MEPYMAEPTGPTEPDRKTAPGSSQGSAAGRPSTRLPGGRIAVAAVAIGAATFLLAAAVLVAVSRGPRNVREGLASLGGELASTREELSGLSGRVAELQRALAAEQDGRIAELEKALRETKDALPGGPPLGQDPELARALEEMARVAALPSLEEGASRHLRNVRKSCEEQRSQQRRRHEEERTRTVRDAKRRRDELARHIREHRNRLHEMIQRETLGQVRQIRERAREAEHRKDWQRALLHYRDVAGLEIRGAADMVAEGKRKLLEIQRKIEGHDRAERKKRREAGREGRPHGPNKAGQEIF